MFNSSCVDCMKGESLESKSQFIRYHAHLLLSRVLPTKCRSSFHELTEISIAVSMFLFDWLGRQFTSCLLSSTKANLFVVHCLLPLGKLIIQPCDTSPTTFIIGVLMKVQFVPLFPAP